MAKHQRTSATEVARAGVGAIGGFGHWRRGAIRIAGVGTLAALAWVPEVVAQEPEVVAQEMVVAISDAQAVEGTDLVFHVSEPTGQDETA